jgi:hypothetical protein
MIDRSKCHKIRIRLLDVGKSVARPDDQEPGKGLDGSRGGQMNTVGPAGKRHVGAAVDKDSSPKRLPNTGFSCLQHSQGKFEELSCSEVFFSDLNEVDSEMHLVSDHLKQRTKPADRFSICYVVTFHRTYVGRGKTTDCYPRN